MTQLFGLSWQTITAFIRIGTNPRAFSNPLSIEEAAGIVGDLLAHPAVVVLTHGDRHWTIFRGCLVEGQAFGPLAMDAHLAALAVEHGAVLCTTDRDFTRFPGLKMLDPLKPESRKHSERAANGGFETARCLTRGHHRSQIVGRISSGPRASPGSFFSPHEIGSRFTPARLTDSDPEEITSGRTPKV